MKLLINIMLLFTLAIALSACVSEEGAHKHAAKGDAVASKAGMVPGMVWKAVLYNTDAKKHTELGEFESRDECYEATQAHMAKHQQAKQGHPASACVIVKSNN